MNTFHELWNQKQMTAEEIAAQIRPGWVCCTDICLGTPYALLQTVGEYLREHRIGDVTLHTSLDIHPLACYQEDIVPYFHGVSWFSGSWAKTAANRGLGDVLPCHYREMPVYARTLPRMDAFFLEVAPMDENGFFSIGVNGSNTQAMLENSARVYLEVNDHMPRGLHSPAVHISQVTGFCVRSAPLPTALRAQPDETSRIIGGLIAEEIPNGATFQLGIGAIPEAVGSALRDKQGLGIHTELLTDSMIDLIKCGAVTNGNKPIHTGRTVATLAYGSREMYDLLHENDLFEFPPVDYTNDPRIIAQHPNFMSVNGALCVDFYGQVCSESVGTRHISGTGGQTDYVRGAVESIGGKSFIAFTSTAQGGTVSRIGSVLPLGSVVSTSKNDVDCIVTEYGIAKLRGKTLSQRTRALIAITHPDFRDSLRFQAKKMNILV